MCQDLGDVQARAKAAGLPPSPFGAMASVGCSSFSGLEQHQHKTGLTATKGQQGAAGRQLVHSLSGPMETLQLREDSMCPDSQLLFNELVSQLSMAACEAQLEHMCIKTDSSSTAGSGVSLYAPAADSRAGSTVSSGSPVSTGAFQEMLFMMMHEEMATHAQLPGQSQ